MGGGWLAFSVMAGPMAFSLAFLLNLVMLRGDCSPMMTTARVGVVVGALLVTIAGGVLSWLHWRWLRDVAHPAGAGERSRNWLLTASGVVLAPLSALLLLFLGGVMMFLDPCGP